MKLAAVPDGQGLQSLNGLHRRLIICHLTNCLLRSEFHPTVCGPQHPLTRTPLSLRVSLLDQYWVERLARSKLGRYYVVRCRFCAKKLDMTTAYGEIFFARGMERDSGCVLFLM